MIAARKDEIGPIQADTVYPLEDFKRRTGQTKASMRANRARGLKVFKLGKRHFIKGADFLAFVESAGIPV